MMKNRFSIETALGDGLRLTFRKPLTIFLWGLLSLAPLAIVFGAMAPLIGRAGAATDPSEIFGGAEAITFNLAAQAANGIQLVVGVFVAAAVLRAVAAAHKRVKARPPFFGFGMTELMTALSMLVVGIALFAILLPIILVGVGLGFGFQTLGGLWVWLPVTLYGLAALVGVIYLCLRLSLLIPASALTGTLALPDAWKATRGQTLRLLGLAILSWLVQLVISTVGLLVIAVPVIGAGMAIGWRWEMLQTPEVIPDLAGAWLIVVAAGVAAVVFTWLQGMTQAMTLAPFTSAWLQLNPPKIPEAADETPPDALASDEL